jgi:hypothetical protein
MESPELAAMREEMRSLSAEIEAALRNGSGARARSRLRLVIVETATEDED